MNRLDSTIHEPPLADQLLSYLVEHPQAQDTLEGLVWWLLERRVTLYTTKVKEALAELVSQGLVLEHPGPDGQLHYRLNRRRLRGVRARLQKS